MLHQGQNWPYLKSLKLKPRWQLTTTFQFVTTTTAEPLKLHFPNIYLGTSLFHKEITVSVTKSSYQNRGRYYLRLTYFFFIMISPFLVQDKKKVVVIAVFPNKLEHRPIFNQVYCKTILIWGSISISITNATHCLQYTPCQFKQAKVSIVTVLLRVKRIIWYLCLNFKICKFTLQLNLCYLGPQFSQTMSIRLHRRIQNSVKPQVESFTKIVNGFQLFTIFVKHSLQTCNLPLILKS